MANAGKKGYIARIGADVSGFESAVGLATDSISSFNKMLNNLNKSIDLDPKNIDVIGTQFLKCSEQSSVFVKALDVMKNGYSDFVAKLDEEDPSGDLSRRFVEDFNKINSLVEKFNTASNTVTPLITDQDVNGLNNFSNAVEKQGSTLDSQKSKLEGLISTYNELYTAVTDAGNAQSESQDKISDVSARASDIKQAYANSDNAKRDDLLYQRNALEANRSNALSDDAVNAKRDRLTASLDNAKSKLQGIDAGSSDYDKITRQIERAQQKLNEFEQHVSDGNIAIAVGFDDEKFNSEIENINGSLSALNIDVDLDEQLSAVTAELNNVTTESERLRSAYEDANTALSTFIANNGDIDRLTTEYNAVTSSIEGLGNASENITNASSINSWGKLSDKLSDMDKASEETKEELERVNAALKLDPKNPELLAQKMRLIGTASGDANEKLKVLASEQEKMKNALRIGEISQEEYNAYEQAIVSCQNEIRDLSNQQEELDNTVKETGMTWKDVFKADLLADFAKEGIQKVIDKTKELAVEALSVGQAFDTAMSKTAGTFAITKTSEEYAKLKAYAQEVGATTKYTATEAAEALNYYALAGYTADEAIASLPATLKLAQAGAMDFASSTDMLTDAYTALGGITSLEDMVDEMTVASQKSNTNIEQLGQAMLTVGATARGLSGGTAELSTMLGILADNGLKGEEGGTKLRNAILSLVKPTNDASEVLDELGISLYDDTGKMLELPEVFLSLNEAMAGLTQEQRDKSVAAIFDTRDLGAVNALLGTTAERYEELETQIINSAGAADALVEVQTDNLESALKILQSAKESLEYSLYDKFADGLQEIALGGADALGKITEMLKDEDITPSIDRLTDAFDNLIDKIIYRLEDGGIVKFVDGLGTLVDVLSWVIDNLELLTTAVKIAGEAFLIFKFKSLVTDIKSFVTSLTSATAATEGATGAQLALNAAQKANLYALIATLAIGAATAVADYLDATSAATAALVAHNSEVEESYLNISKFRESVEESKKALDDNLASVDKNTNRIKDRWHVLQNMVDEEGNLISSEADVQRVLLELNTLMGSNITLIDGQIQGYKDLASSMDGYIENLRTEAKLNYMKQGYEEAVGTIDDARSSATDYAHVYSDKYIEANNYREEYKQAYSKGMSSDEWKAFESKYKNIISYKNNEDFASYLLMMNGGSASKAKASVGYNSYAAYLDYQAQMARNDFEAQKKVVSDLENTMTEYEDTIIELEKKKTEVDEAFAESAGVTVNNDDINGSTGDDNTSDDKTSDLKKAMQDLDDELAIHAKTEEEYYNARQDKLNEFKDDILNGEDIELKKEWWDYQDKVTNYFTKKAKSESDDAVKLAKDALSKLEDGVKEEITKLENKRDEDDSDNYNEEWYAKELEKVIKRLEGTDIYDTYYKKLLDAKQKVKDANDKASKEEIDAWGKRSEDTVKAIKDNYKKVEEAYNSAQQSLANSVKIAEKAKDKQGKDRYMLTDYEKEGRRIDAYDRSVERLKETGISDDFYNEIMSLDFASGEREGVIKEILSLSDKNRKELYADYDKFIEKTKKAGANQVENKLDEANKAAVEGITDIYGDMPKSAYEKGIETANAYIQGITDGMVDVNTMFSAMGIETGKSVISSPVDYVNTTTVEGSAISNTPVISENTPIIINVAGEQVINKKLKDFLNMNTLTGGNNTGL